MIEEDYVSFEIAKLLKEKGFDITLCNTCYKYNGKFCNNRKSMSGVDNMICYPAPTLQMAMKWIREQGFYINVDIDVDYNEDERGTKWYHKPAWDWAVFRIDERKQMSDDGALYATYEQAAEVAIKWCLENLF